ncbi:MAG: pantoate--beta-alanine ligase [Gemmatimonadetes bacterium]|nr:pantoate--beta-alanine ligase [Gemmatimonadota bacterium]
MDLVTTPTELRAAIAALRTRRRPIALVPTMGALHEGHLTLVDAAKAREACVVATIFVNPLQFGPNEDLARYPRDAAGDRLQLDRRGADLLYAPSVDAMYPTRPVVTVDPGPLGSLWEGSVRPGHFAGVLTVVAKLFHQTMPEMACFGQKDIQQATMIRRMVRDLDWPVEIIVVPISREADGLARSSRNRYLGPEDRRRAAVLFQALSAVERRWRAGVTESNQLASVAATTFAAEPAVTVDYIAIVDPEGLEPVTVATPGTVVAVAARVGGTRLIDNVILG